MARDVRTHLLDGDSPKNPMVRRHLDKKEFGKRLYSLMRERGWSQSDLARESDIPRDAISRYIRAASLPEPKNLEKLAVALRMSPNDLLPNYALVEVELADDPPLEIKVSPGDPSMAWIRINRMVKTSSIPAILQAIEAAEND